MKGLTEQKAELKALGKTDASQPAVVGRYVIDPLVMSDGEVKFSWRQYRFANLYRKSLDLDAACAESGMTKDSALRFLRRPDVDRWMGDRQLMANAKRRWSAEGRWEAEGEKMAAQEVVPKHRIEIWKEFGERYAPKPSRGVDNNLTTNRISINIAPEAIAAFREREKAVEAEIVGDESGFRGSPEPR